MRPSEISFWKIVADDLGIEVIAPYEAKFSDGSRLQVSALVKNFGPARGMLVDADYRVFEPHIHNIHEFGYGYCANIGRSSDDYERSSMIEVLKDWGWSGAIDQKPAWFR